MGLQRAAFLARFGKGWQALATEAAGMQPGQHRALVCYMQVTTSHPVEATLHSIQRMYSLTLPMYVFVFFADG